MADGKRRSQGRGGKQKKRPRAESAGPTERTAAQPTTPERTTEIDNPGNISQSNGRALDRWYDNSEGAPQPQREAPQPQPPTSTALVSMSQP